MPKYISHILTFDNGISVTLTISRNKDLTCYTKEQQQQTPRTVGLDITSINTLCIKLSSDV